MATPEQAQTCHARHKNIKMLKRYLQNRTDFEITKYNYTINKTERECHRVRGQFMNLRATRPSTRPVRHAAVPERQLRNGGPINRQRIRIDMAPLHFCFSARRNRHQLKKSL